MWSKKSSGEDTVKVGLLHSLTGSMAISEEAVRDAEVWQLKRLIKMEVVLGKKIKYVEEDGASEPSNVCDESRKID